MLKIRIVLASIIALCLVGVAAAQDHDHRAAAGSNEKLGTVVFATSCSAAAAPQFNRAVALLHSFEFGRAIEGFTTTLKTDPSCAMAEWGIALSRWSNPFAPGIRPAPPLALGREAVERARRLGTLRTTSPREAAYIDAVAKLYTDFEKVDQRTRVVAYRDAMTALAAKYADDTEAAIFSALAIAAAAPPTDKTYADLLKAGAILEKIAKSQPDHPGLAHYIIHSYDVPPLADRALEAARLYAKIAPSAPHALHMPSHTFTRVGYWQESIDTNTASAEVARKDGAVGEELHATDYRVYAYLQTGQDAAAKRLLDGLPAQVARFDPSSLGSAAPPAAGFFAIAAIPARYALERGAWSDAARLETRPSPFGYADALTWFARALGAARSGDAASLATTRSAIDELAKIQEKLTAQGEAYWAGQTDIQRRAAAAWLALAEGRKDEAIAGMRTAAVLEDATEKAAVTPGPLAPARELLGEMLLQTGSSADALREFETTLAKEPNRFRALSGAAAAATKSGERDKARRYASQLVKVCERADAPGRPELQAARKAQ